MDSSVVPDQRARLSELLAAFGAQKRLQVNVPLVVHNQACALWESLLAGNAVRVDEIALEHRFEGVSSALDWDCHLLIGVLWKYLKACVVLPALDGRFVCYHWLSSSMHELLMLDSLILPWTRQVV